MLAKVRRLLNLKVGAHAHLGELELKIAGEGAIREPDGEDQERGD